MIALTAMRKAAAEKGATMQTITRAGQLAIVGANGFTGHLTAWAEARKIYDQEFGGRK